MPHAFRRPRQWMALGLTLLLLAGLLMPLQVVAQPANDAATGPSPASGHAQVIAHGVALMPASEVAWRVRDERAPLPNRAAAEPRPAGFVVGDDGVVAVTSATGIVRARIPAGEATWLDPNRPEAVVSLEDRPVTYFAVDLISAADAGDSRDLIGSVFPVATGAAHDMVLLRDVLTRGEESDLLSEHGPALLVVTSGRIALDLADDVSAEFQAGDVTEFSGEAVVTGAGRAPASFLVAMLGPEVPATVQLRDNLQPTVAPIPSPSPTATATATPARTPTPVATATPSPTATPGPTATPSPTPSPPPVRPAALAVSSFICPVAYEGSDFAADCINPSSGVEFILSAGHAVIDSQVADANGDVTFAQVVPANYVLAAGVPGDFASSRVRCLNAFGDDIARREATNQVALLLEDGDDIACNWYIVPEDARGEEPSATLTIDIRACPEGMTPDNMAGEVCPPAPAGTMLVLTRDGAPVGVASATAALWEWQSLQPVPYGLDVTAVPAGFGDFQLDDQRCCGANTDFTIQISKGLVDHHRTLYLFRLPTPELTLDIDILACEPGMTVDTLDPAGCTPAPAGVGLSLTLDGAPVAPSVSNAALWRWEGLGPFSYGLDVSTPADQYSGMRLDDQRCCGQGSDFIIQMPRGFVETQRTLYLFQPGPVELPQPVPDASVSVFISACPAGMTVETLVEAACIPAPPGASLSLFDQGVPLPVSSADASLWTWPNLRFASYTLHVNAIPAGFESFSLNLRTCCNADGGFTVGVSEETPHTGYTLFLYPPNLAPLPEPEPEPDVTLPVEPTPEAVAELTVEETPMQVVDPDGDGLPTTDEEGFFHTDPQEADSDGDGFNDDDEIAAGTDPLDSGDW